MMYNHISGKCKALAKAICWIGMIGSIIGGAALIIAGIETYGYNQTLYIVIGAATVLLGPLFSWLGSIGIYAIGEAAENSAIAANLIIKADQEREQEKKMTAFSSPETVEMTAIHPSQPNSQQAAEPEPVVREQRQAAGTLQHENTAPAAVIPAVLPDTAQMPIRNAVRCPECGKELSTRASVSPNCGAPIAGKKIPVHFERKKSFAGSANTGSVIIDGLTVGSAGNGTSFDVMLTPGIHNVVIQSQTQGVLAAGRNYSTTLEIPDSAKRVNVTIVVKTDTQSFLSGGMAIVIGDIQIIK